MSGAKQQRDSISDIADYYSRNNEDARRTNQQLEHVLTTLILKKYIPGNSKILELGAGTGHYTQALAEAGHDVTAVELVPSLCRTNEKRLKETGLMAQVVTGDARDVLQLVNGPFDIVLAMGPFYHLTQANERLELLEDLKELIKPGGKVVCTHLTRIGLISYMLARSPAWVSDNLDQFDRILSVGYFKDHPRDGNFRGYFTTEDEVRAMHATAGLDVDALLALDPCIGPFDEVYNQLTPELKATWAELLMRVIPLTSVISSGRSFLSIAHLPSQK